MQLPILLLRTDLRNSERRLPSKQKEKERRQTREYSHTVLLKAVCHLIQKVQSEHVQTDLYKGEKDNLQLLYFGRREEEGNEKRRIESYIAPTITKSPC